MCDNRCHEEHDSIITELKEHTHPHVDRIIDLLEGPKVKHLDGTNGPDRVESLGMKSTLDTVVLEQQAIRADIANGYHIRGKDLIKIVSAVSTAVVTILGTFAALF